MAATSVRVIPISIRSSISWLMRGRVERTDTKAGTGSRAAARAATMAAMANNLLRFITSPLLEKLTGYQS
jgi:hypothetical protein